MLLKNNLKSKGMTRGEWYLISVALIGGVTLVIMLTMLVIKYLKKKLQQRSNPEIRLSAAYREGFLREDSNSHRRLESSFHLRQTDSKPNKVNRMPHDTPNQPLMPIGSSSNKYGGVNPQTRSADDQFIKLKSNSTSKEGGMERIGSEYFDTFIEVVHSENTDYSTSKKQFTNNEISMSQEHSTNSSSNNQPLPDNKSIYPDTLHTRHSNNHIQQCPKIHLNLQYNQQNLLLSVTIHSITDLPRMRTNLSCDPFIKLQLLPDESLQVKTRVIRSTQNPVFEEQFDFYNISNITHMTLHFSIFTFDHFSRNCKIGDVYYPLLDFGNKMEMRMEGDKTMSNVEMIKDDDNDDDVIMVVTNDDKIGKLNDDNDDYEIKDKDKNEFMEGEEIRIKDGNDKMVVKKDGIAVRGKLGKDFMENEKWNEKRVAEWVESIIVANNENEKKNYENKIEENDSIFEKVEDKMDFGNEKMDKGKDGSICKDLQLTIITIPRKMRPASKKDILMRSSGLLEDCHHH